MCFAAARASLSRRSSGDDRMMEMAPAISVTRLIAQRADWLAKAQASLRHRVGAQLLDRRLGYRRQSLSQQGARVVRAAASAITAVR